MSFYCGIGSRKTPDNILNLMTNIAIKLGTLDYVLRSGGAHGADSAFARGSIDSHIYIPWKGFNGIYDCKLSEPEEHTYAIAESLHPAWHRCSNIVKKLHARNIHQVLGDTRTPDHCDFVICWTPGGKLVGGTATALNLAKLHDIPIYNLANDEDMYGLTSEVLDEY